MLNANLNETATAFGIVRIIKRNSEGEIVEDHLFKNQLTNYARQQAANLWAGPAANNYVPVTLPTTIQVGTGAPTPPLTGVDPTDTGLWTAMSGSSKTFDYSTVWLNYTTQYAVTYQQTDAVGTWTELGLFQGANLWAHVQLTNFVKASGDTVTVQWNVLHIGN